METESNTAAAVHTAQAHGSASAQALVMQQTATGYLMDLSAETWVMMLRATGNNIPPVAAAAAGQVIAAVVAQTAATPADAAIQIAPAGPSTATTLHHKATRPLAANDSRSRIKGTHDQSSNPKH